MKRQLFLLLLLTTVLLTSIGAHHAASAQFSEARVIKTIEAVAKDDVAVPKDEPDAEEQHITQEFRGANLTSQQLEQVRQARRQFHGEIEQALFNYSNSVSDILTPEQRQIWQRNLEADAQLN